MGAAQCLFEHGRGVAAVCPQLLWSQPPPDQRGRRAAAGDAARSRCPRPRAPPAARRARLRRGGSGCRACPGACARPSRPLFRLHQRGTTITRDQSSLSAPASWPAARAAPPAAARAATTPQTPPAGLSAGQPQFTVGHLQPRGVGVEHKQNPLQACTGGIAQPARVAEPSRGIGEQRLQRRPQLVRDPPLQRLRPPHPSLPGPSQGIHATGLRQQPHGPSSI